MDAHDIEETGAVAAMNARYINSEVQGPVALTRLRKDLRDALEAIADLTRIETQSRLVVEIHQALSAFEDLWRDSEAAQEGADNASISVVGELASAWLMNRLVAHVRALECSIADDESSIWNELITGAISATRWAARWCWLRYKQPSTRLWANAAYLYQLSERRLSPAQCRWPADAGTPCGSARREFAWLLFAQWVSPISLPVAAQMLFEQLLHESSAQPTIARTPTSSEDALFDVDSGRVLFRRQTALDASTRYIAFGLLRQEICRRATQLALADVDKSEPAKQLLRSVIGRRTRTLVRLGSRFEMLRRFYACVGYEMIAKNLRSQDQCLVEGFVLDRSEEGCRIRFERSSVETNALCVGALLQLKEVFEGEVCLGTVRWLNRTESEGWELGVWLMRGAVHARNVRKKQGVWPSSKRMENVLLVNSDDRASAGPTLCILPKHSALPGVQLIGDDDEFRCEVMTCIESGANFDVAIVQIDAMQEPRVKLCSLNSQGDLL